MGLDSNGCWLGNYCMPIESGGCPSTTGAVTLSRNMKRTLRMTTKNKTDTDNKLGLVTRAKKWDRGIFSFRCPTSRSDFEMTNKINNDKLKKNLFVKPLTKTLPLLGSGSDYGSGASGAGTCFEPYTQVSLLSHLQPNDNNLSLCTIVINCPLIKCSGVQQH